jgi:hypothetical protein
MRLLLPLILSIGLTIFAAYCFYRGEVPVRGQGWKSKDETPKTFFLTVFFFLLLGVLGIAGYFGLHELIIKILL